MQSTPRGSVLQIICICLNQKSRFRPLSEASCETIRNSLGPGRSALQFVLCGISVDPTAVEHFMIQKNVACWPTLRFASADTSVVLESVKRYTAL